MRRVWATVASVWALLAIVAGLAWTRQPVAAPPQQVQPTTLVVPTANGGKQLVVVPASAPGAPHATTQTSPAVVR